MTERDYDRMEQSSLDYQAGYEDGWLAGWHAHRRSLEPSPSDPNQPKLDGWDVT